jgi:hypothetical protein
MHFAEIGTRDMKELMTLGEIEHLTVSAGVTAFVRYSDCTIVYRPLEFVLIVPKI